MRVDSGQQRDNQKIETMTHHYTGASLPHAPKRPQFFFSKPDRDDTGQVSSDHLTPGQQRARATFDLDKAMASLPAPGRAVPSPRGSMGIRLRKHLKGAINDGLLREFGQDVLKAKRMSAKYLDALRIVLGNQADAERRGYILEMNLRLLFASERVMRNIIDQMKAAGICEGRRVFLGGSKVQTVQCFNLIEPDDEDDLPDLEDYLRDWEDRADTMPPTLVGPDALDAIAVAEVPY